MYANMRAEMYWRFKRALELGFAIDPTNRERLLIECGMERVPGPKLQVELKHQIRKRLGRSPDTMDAWAISFAEPPGKPIFRIERQAHQVRSGVNVRRPTAAKSGVEFWLDGNDDPMMRKNGEAYRTWWLGHQTGMACCWIFVDTGGNWVVFDAIEAESNRTMEEFMLTCKHRHKLDFSIDVCSAPDSEELQIDLSVMLGRLVDRSNPYWIQPGEVAGKQGMDQLSARLINTLAYYPDLAYWAGHQEDAKSLQGQPMLVIAPEGLLDQLDACRFYPQAVSGIDGVAAPERIIEGPMVKAMRIFALEMSGC
jgi:hypothetical protein